MTDWTGRRWWLVGASDGLGLALAHRMSSAGCDLVLSARDPDRLAAAAAGLSRPARAVPCDVADRADVERAAAEVGQLDGMVFLAGVYWPMRAQDWDAEKVVAMCNVNLTGCARTVGSVLPGMVERNAGHIVITGSLAGFRGLPGAVGYGASKAGCMSLAETLHADLRGSGVKVQLVNPGFVRTRLTDLNRFSMPQIMEPEAAAEAIFAHMQTRRFALSFPAPFAWAFRLAQFLPQPLYDRFFGTPKPAA